MKDQNMTKLQSLLEAVSEEQELASKNIAPEDPFHTAKTALKSLDKDFILYVGEIHFGHESDLEEILSTIEAPKKEVILWLTTPGGNPDAAYSMARLLQRRYKGLTVFVNGWCKSSGTLMCLGASEIVMGDLAQLGPLDIQILNREEFGERHSGLNPIEALKSISYQSTELLRQQFLEIRFGGGLSTRQALEVATNLTGQLMSPITSQLDIMKYGEFTRSMRIAIEYGSRLAKFNSSGNVKSDAITLLTTGYPSHGFVIDREEASEKLFNHVTEPGWELKALENRFQQVIDKHMSGHNSRALLVDLRKALKVDEPERLDEEAPNELNSSLNGSSEEIAEAVDQVAESVQFQHEEHGHESEERV